MDPADNIVEVNGAKVHVHLSPAYMNSVKRVIKISSARSLEENSQMWATATKMLLQFVKDNRLLKVDYFPREHFAKEQVCLVALDFLNQIKRVRMSFLDVREDFGNLATLHDYLRNRDTRAARLLASLLKQLITGIGDLAESLEKTANVYRTNWQKVAQVFAESSQGNSPLEWAAFIPSLKNINSIRLLGAGGFGSIYKIGFSQAFLTGKLVPRSKFKDALQACADKFVASMISHPLLVYYQCCFATEEAFVTIMEYIRGVDLNKVAKLGTVMPSEANQLVMAQLGMAVQYLHYKGFIHRDIKPSNMMILAGCRIKLIDFDTCKISTGWYLKCRYEGYFRRTFLEFEDGQSAGTLLFLPPEILKRKKYGRAVDWWAVGVTAYLLCTGRLPFRGTDGKISVAKLRTAIVEFKGDNDGDPKFRSLCLKLMQKMPLLRYTSHNFEAYKLHPFFDGLEWDRIGTAKQQEFDYPEINILLEKNPTSGLYSPKEEVCDVNKGSNKRKLITFDEVTDTPVQTPIYTFSQPGFIKGLKKVRSGQSCNNDDLAEPPELVTDNAVKHSVYKFLDYATKPEGYVSMEARPEAAQIMEESVYNESTINEGPRKADDLLHIEAAHSGVSEYVNVNDLNAQKSAAQKVDAKKSTAASKSKPAALKRKS